MTPIALSDQLRAFGTIYGQVVALKPLAAKYPQTYNTWQDLMTRGENLRQTAATVASMGAVTGQLETLVAGVLGSLFPASILPAGINQANLYAISGWEDDANAFMKQMQQISALEQSGLSTAEVSNTIQPQGIGTTISNAVKTVTSGATNLLMVAAIVGGVYIYISSRRKR